MTTIPQEKWGLRETADWWSAGQASRQQIYGTATAMMLDLASVQRGRRVLDVAAGTGESAIPVEPSSPVITVLAALAFRKHRCENTP